jgi:CubicO group peptidase (beta-lactamase class C family)
MRAYKSILSLVLILIFWCWSYSVATEEPSVIDANLINEITDLTNKYKVPSVQIAIVSNHEVVWSQSFGADVEKNKVYMIGSVQKVFDATAIMQLYEKGLIDLDADIDNYLPFSVRHPDYPDIPITVWMLVCHRSGLVNFNYHFAWETKCLGYPEYRRTCNDKLLDLNLSDYLSNSFSVDGINYSPEAWVSKPGDEYHYSVSGYSILKLLIERASKQSYDDYMRENIFEPLTMENAGFYVSEFGETNATPYTYINGQYIELPLWDGGSPFMRMTAVDLVKFQLAHLYDGSYQDFQMIQPETVELMQTITTPRFSIFNLDSKLYGADLGLGIRHYQNGWMGSGGSVPGYTCIWRFNPEAQVGYSFLINVNSIIQPNKSDLKVVSEFYSELQNIIENKLVPPPIFTARRVIIAIMCISLIAIASGIIRKKKRSQFGHNRV